MNRQANAFHVSNDKISLTSAKLAYLMQCGHSKSHKITMTCRQSIRARDVPLKTEDDATSW
jgi:hypothetical protein